MGKSWSWMSATDEELQEYSAMMEDVRRRTEEDQPESDDE